MIAKKGKTKERLSLDFPYGAKEKFEQIRLKSGAPTITDVFRRALSYYEFFLDQQEAGARITIEAPNRDKEVIRVI